jgi:hypothetical protein
MSLSPGKIVDGLLGVEDSIGDFIANGPSTGFGGHVRDEYRKRCNQYANLPAWARALGGVPGGAMSRVCQPYWDDNGWDGPSRDAPPFTGGQCATPYNVRVVDPQGPIIYFEDTLQGPIGGFTTSPAPGFFRLFLNVPFAGGIAQRNIQDPGAEALARLEQTVTRADGQPDNCGDLPTELEPGTNPPPNPGPTPGPEPTADPSNPSGPPLLPVEPYIDPIYGPIPVEGPDDGGGGTEPPGNPDTSPGSPENVGAGIPGTETPEDGADTPFEDPPEGKVFIGALIKFNFPEELGNIPGSGPQNRVVSRTVGNASLIFEGGRGTAELVRSEWIYLVRPTGALEVSGVHVNALPGTTYTVYPLSIEKCPENQCGEQ